MRASLHSSTTHPLFLGPQYQIQLPAHRYRISATVTSACSARIIGSRPRPIAPPSRSSGYQVPCEGRFSHPTVGLPAPPLSFQRYDLSPTVLYPLAIYPRVSLVPVACSLGPLVTLSHASCLLPSQWHAIFKLVPGCSHIRRLSLTLLTRLGIQQDKA